MCLAGDESSAFQLAGRVEMRRQLMAHFPHFIPFFAACYDAPAALIYGAQSIPAAQAGTGSQQGCPWGTFLHGLSQKRRVERLISDNPDVHIFLLADDIFIVGLPHLVMQVWIKDLSVARHQAWRSAGKVVMLRSHEIIPDQH
eukprot:COSAG05_NODE_1312_length_5217_cov_2.233685_1_plen_142_part_10